MWFGSREDEVGRLERAAQAALEGGDFDAADAIAARLLELGWSGGFEIAALAARGRGEPALAAKRLEEGVEKAPGAGSLWLLLGVVRSDLARYDAALDAFERALSAEGAEPITVRFNRAVAHQRRGNPGAALDDLEVILSLPKPPPFAEDALALAAECLATIGRADDGLTMVRAAHDACAADDPRRPRLSAELAVALERAGGDEAEVRQRFLEAASAGVATPAFLALGRRLSPLPSESPRLHHLVVQADPIEPDAAGLLRVFQVVADDPAGALTAARAYLPEAVRESAAIEQHQDRGPASDEPGVHGASELLHYADES